MAKLLPQKSFLCFFEKANIGAICLRAVALSARERLHVSGHFPTLPKLKRRLCALVHALQSAREIKSH
jgi:hypothetical protein